MAFDFTHCQIVDLRLEDQFGGIVEANIVSAGIRRQGDVVGRDQGRYELSSIANHNDILEVRTQLQTIFDGLGRDIFTAGGYDKVLLAIGDFQIPIRIQFPSIARMKPASTKRLCRFTLHLVIARHDVRAANQNFTVIGNLHLHVAHRPPYSADARGAGTVERNDWGGFRQTVSFEDGQAHRVEKLCDFLLQRCAARYEKTKPPAKPLPDLLKNRTICGTMR